VDSREAEVPIREANSAWLSPDRSKPVPQVRENMIMIMRISVACIQCRSRLAYENRVTNHLLQA
jgi:hypothetical protein